MSVVGIGTDIVEIGRIRDLLANHGERFLTRCFREDLPAGAESFQAENVVIWAAGRWAAKEAVLKALGADIVGIPYRDVEVLPSGGGPPRIRLHGLAQSALDGAGGRSIFLSISHEREFAVATALVQS